MPRISVFTPSHRTNYLSECYASLQAQTFTDWEWVILLNGTAVAWDPPRHDPRVRVERAAGGRRVGTVKKAACARCTGDILVELDHDDVLAPTCLAEIDAAFAAHPEASLVFSDFTQINEDGSPNHERFNEAMGWQYSDVTINRRTYLRCHALHASPHNAAYIWYAPNHVRAFRRDRYEEVGGYNSELSVLDDQELMMRLYRVGDFHLVEHCLYLQRMHTQNTQRDAATNKYIQEQTVRYYDEWIEQLAVAWARRSGLAAVTVRTAQSPPGVDDGLDVIEIDADEPKLPFDADSVGVIKANELLQRIPDRARFFNECYRVLRHGGLVLTLTPSTDGRGAFQDPSHIAYYNENSFWYLTQANLRSWSLPDLTARLQVSRVRTYFPTTFDEANNIAYVQANLIAVKDGPRQGGPLLC